MVGGSVGGGGGGGVCGGGGGGGGDGGGGGVVARQTGRDVNHLWQLSLLAGADQTQDKGIRESSVMRFTHIQNPDQWPQATPIHQQQKLGPHLPAKTRSFKREKDMFAHAGNALFDRMVDAGDPYRKA